jgi:uncharacterized membrane protein YbhN (UPF0104 family)
LQTRSLTRWFRLAPPALGIVLLVGAVYVVQREFRHLRIDDIARALSAIPARALLRAAGFTVLAYGVLTLYDRLGTIYAGHKVSYRRVAFASFCAYALSHNLGFSAVSGAAVRFRLYGHWGLSPLQIGKVIAFCSLTFSLGGLVLTGAILFLEPSAVPFFGHHLPPVAFYAVGLALWAVVLGYTTLSRLLGSVRLFGHVVELPGWRMAILQVMLATADVAVAAAIFYSLLPPGHGLGYLRFVAVYVASYTAGLLANLPGGLGVFDSAMLFGLSGYLEAPQIIGAILIFRLYYYIVPLFLAGTLFAGNEIMLRGHAMRQGMQEGVQAIGRWSEPDFAVAAATGAVALCGALLLSLGAVAAPLHVSWIDPDFFAVAAEAGQFVPSLIGAGLLVLAIGLSQRVRLAWGATIAALLGASAVVIVQGEPLWIPGTLMLATFVLAPYRRAFYRHARLLSGPLEASSAASLFALLGCLTLVPVFARHVQLLSASSWWRIVLSRQVPDSLRASLALSVLVGLLAIWRLIRPGRVAWQPWDGVLRRRYLALGGTLGDAPGTDWLADGVIWGEAGRALLAFRRAGPLLLALGDPVGDQGDRASTIWRLCDLARQERRSPAVYGAGPELLDTYHDLGLAALPLGADGLPRQGGSIESAQAFLVCRAERDLATLLPVLTALIARQAAIPRDSAAACQPGAHSKVR